MERSDSFMNWGFKPHKSVDELYYIIYKLWNDEGDTSFQSPAHFKPFDEDPLQFLEKQIVVMCGEIFEFWEGDFGDLDYCKDIISGEEQFPIDVYYRGGRITNPFISVDFNPDNPDDIYNALYGEYPIKFAKEIMKSITKDNLQKWLKERKEYMKDKPWYRNTTTILKLTDSIGDESTAITHTIFNKKF